MPVAQPMTVITVGADQLVLIPFTSLPSFSRTYENFLDYARRKGYKEFKCKEMVDRTTIILRLSREAPSLRHVAFGESLPPLQGEEDTKTFLWTRFKKDAKPDIQMIPVDMTLDEDEYEKAVCVFRV
jgi:hypothetical protein